MFDKMYCKSVDSLDITNFVIENNTLHGVKVDLQLKTENVGQAIFQTLGCNLEHIAQVDADTDKRTTYGEMKDDSVRCALWLKKQGIGSGDVVTICMYDHLDTYIPIFATFYVGATFNVWNHDVTIKSARRFIKLIRPKVIFVWEGVLEVLKEAAQLEHYFNVKLVVFGKRIEYETLVDIMEEQSRYEIQSFSPVEISDPQNTVAMIALSSDGPVKGVDHSYKSLLENSILFAPMPADKVSLSYASPYLVSYIALIIKTTLCQGTRIIHRNFNPKHTCKVINEYEIRLLLASPTMINYIYKSNALDKYKLESLQYVLISGSKVNSTIYKKFKQKLPHALIVQGYGLIETLRCVAIQTKKCKSDDSIGFVGPNVSLKVVNLTTGKAVEPNVEGELCVKMPDLFCGYYKNSIRTKELFDNEGWLHTDDLAYYDDGGEIFIVDRLKDKIIVKFDNERISASEIEEILLTHPGVTEVAVVPKPHDIHGEHAVAFVRRTSGLQVSENELIELSASFGRHRKLHGGVKFIENIPKTAGGKVSSNKLKKMAHLLALER
ncbi:uncharacterized protein LOC131667932 [Phymastichus coffea]|uniref:uncharacterized protein LOC131667932 n=1 Tax=Phymastichus coffea TaxID=108790 RepID=UPI00273BF72B|nr:uncharacterized protein LOC131667932 [Phymastichus coffea]